MLTTEVTPPSYDNLFSEVIRPDFRKPTRVPIIEFCESDAYCGRPLYPAQRVLLKLWFLEEMEGWEEDILSSWIRGDDGVIISPMIRERRDWLRLHNFPHFREIVNVLGRRAGKGYMSGAAMASLVHYAAQFADPGANWGIDSEKQLSFLVVAAAFKQAKDEQWTDVASWIKNCKPLIQAGGLRFLEESFTIRTAADDQYKNELRAAGVEISAEWAKLACLPVAANAGTVRGKASMCIVYDEMAHMLGVDGKAAADQVFAAANPSLRQFGADSMIFCNSTPWTMFGQFYEEAQKGLQVDDEAQPSYPTMMMMKAPAWAMFRHWRKDPKRRFEKVGALQVSPDDDPATLIEEEVQKQIIAKEEERGDPEKYAVETRAEWQTGEDSFLNAIMVDRMFNPFEITQENDDGEMVTIFSREFRQQSVQDYHFAYAGHCDPSSTTAGYGAAIAHTELMPDPHFPGEMVPHVIFDFVKRWNPADFPEHTIDYLKVQREIAEYIQFFKPYQWTFDQYESTMPIQWLRMELRRRRINTQVFEQVYTAPKNWLRYSTFKTACYLGLVHIPRDCGPLIVGSDGWGSDSQYSALELKFLQHKSTSTINRVEKPSMGPIQTKDIADCISEVTAHLIGDWVQQRAEALEQGIRMGAEGGYQIGGRQKGGPYAGGSPGYGTGITNVPQSGIPDTFKSSPRTMTPNPARGFDPRRKRRQ